MSSYRGQLHTFLISHPLSNKYALNICFNRLPSNAILFRYESDVLTKLSPQYLSS